jgi:hypothetical protein
MSHARSSGDFANFASASASACSAGALSTNMAASSDSLWISVNRGVDISSGIWVRYRNRICHLVDQI